MSRDAKTVQADLTDRIISKAVHYSDVAQAFNQAPDCELEEVKPGVFGRRITEWSIVGLSFLSLIIAQSTNTNDTGLEIEAIEAHFEQSDIVPSLLSTFIPSALLTVSFDGVGAISPGQSLSQNQVAVVPTIAVTPANSSVSLTGNFTIMMVDADIVGANDTQVNRHWLVNGVTITGSSLSNNSAVPVTAYQGPGPASGSGSHRYVILLYSQPGTFQPPSDLAGPVPGVNMFSLSQYVQGSGLGSVVAGMYFDVEVGTATVSVSATSAVVSSTLPPVNSGSSTGSGAQPTQTGKGNSGTKAAQVSSLLFALMFGVIVLA